MYQKKYKNVVSNMLLELKFFLKKNKNIKNKKKKTYNL